MTFNDKSIIANVNKNLYPAYYTGDTAISFNLEVI
jgi:hypothetical protein